MDSFCTSRKLLGVITLLLVCWYCHVRWQVAGGGGMLKRGLGEEGGYRTSFLWRDAGQPSG